MLQDRDDVRVCSSTLFQIDTAESKFAGVWKVRLNTIAMSIRDKNWLGRGGGAFHISRNGA